MLSTSSLLTTSAAPLQRLALLTSAHLPTVLAAALHTSATTSQHASKKPSDDSFRLPLGASVHTRHYSPDAMEWHER